jgi:tetratricopeptide (TPR) repeat protein
MSFWIRIAFAAWLGIALGGCSPSGQPDEEKEPHYVLGQGRVNAMDYQGAIEAFEESLEVNPHSAAAHFALAWLYDQKVPDPAAAIYHYEQFLKLNPNADNAAVIRQRMDACKQQLAKDVLLLPSSPAAEEQLEKLAAQNRQLEDEVETLKKWNAYYAGQLGAVKTNLPPTPNIIAAQQSQIPVQPAPVVVAQNGAPNKTHSPDSTTPRTHTVVSGETAVGIARKFGIKLTALESANPGMNPGRIRVGQLLKIPSS